MKIILMKLFLFFRKKQLTPAVPIFIPVKMRTPLIEPKPPKGEEKFV